MIKTLTKSLVTTLICLLFIEPSFAGLDDPYATRVHFRDVSTCNQFNEPYFPSSKHLPRHCFSLDSVSPLAGPRVGESDRAGTMIIMKLNAPNRENDSDLDTFAKMRGFYGKIADRKDSTGRLIKGREVERAMARECVFVGKMNDHKNGDKIPFFVKDNFDPNNLPSKFTLNQVDEARGLGGLAIALNEPHLNIRATYTVTDPRTGRQVLQANDAARFPDVMQGEGPNAMTSVTCPLGGYEQSKMATLQGLKLSATNPIFAALQKSLQVSDYQKYASDCDRGGSMTLEPPPLVSNDIMAVTDTVGFQRVQNYKDGDFVDETVMTAAGNLWVLLTEPNGRVHLRVREFVWDPTPKKYRVTFRDVMVNEDASHAPVESFQGSQNEDGTFSIKLVRKDGYVQSVNTQLGTGSGWAMAQRISYTKCSKDIPMVAGEVVNSSATCEGLKIGVGMLTNPVGYIVGRTPAAADIERLGSIGNTFTESVVAPCTHLVQRQTQAALAAAAAPPAKAATPRGQRGTGGRQ